MDSNRSTSSTNQNLVVTSTTLFLYGIFNHMGHQNIMAMPVQEQMPLNNAKSNKEDRQANKAAAEYRLMQQMNQQPTHTKHDIHHSAPHLSRLGKR